MMDGDVARESSGNDDFDIIGESPGCSKTVGDDGVVVSVEVDLVANGDESSASKQLDDEESPEMNGDGMAKEEEIVNGRMEEEEADGHNPKQSAEELMDELGISMDSGVQEEPESNGSPDAGEVVEEVEVSATTQKTEEASLSLDALDKQEEAEPTPEAGDVEVEDGVSIEVGKVEDDTEETKDSTPEDPLADAEDIPEPTPEDATEETKDSPEDAPSDLIEDSPKDIPETEDPNEDSAVDVNLDTSQDTSHDISQDISLDKVQDISQDDESPEPPAAGDDDDDQTPTEQSLDDSLKSEEENDAYGRPGLTRSKSSRLDASKFSKFESSSSNHSSDSEGSAASKRHTVVGTGRLNMSRFSQFEKGSDSTDSISRPIKRNTGTRSKSLKFGSSTVTSEMCHVCNKRVYPMEKISADNTIYHKICFKCAECHKVLSLGQYAACKGNIFCKPHFKQIFKLKGNYDFASQGKPQPTATTTNGVSGLDESTDSINTDRSMEGSTLESPRLAEAPISPTLNQSEESTPPSVVRSSDRPEEAMQVEGGTGSVKSRFESGDFQNTTPSPTRSKSVDIYDAPKEKGVAESTPVRREDIFHADEAQEEVRVTSGGIGKFKNMFEVGGVTNLEHKSPREQVNVRSLDDYDSTNQGHVAENTPVLREDVVRSSDTSEDPGIKQGISRSLKNRWETERISNIEEKPRGKIEIAAAEERRVYQPPEKPRREDVVNTENYSEDPGIKSGQARSLRSLFEKGNVSNVVEKPRAPLDRNPRSLEDYATENQVSESTPVRKDDVVSSSSTVDEPMRSAESTRSMKQRWESGQVERVPEKPKPALERKPQSLDNYSMTMVVSENTPEERTDIVKSSANSDDYLLSKGSNANSIKAQWESGQVYNDDTKTDNSDSNPKRFSSYNYEAEDQPNGVAEHENGITEEREEGEVEQEEEDSNVDASWEIKAARAAAMADFEDE